MLEEVGLAYEPHLIDNSRPKGTMPKAVAPADKAGDAKRKAKELTKEEDYRCYWLETDETKDKAAVDFVGRDVVEPERRLAVRGQPQLLEPVPRPPCRLQPVLLVAEETVEDLPAIYELIKGLGIMRWSLFMLIAVGRGKQLNELLPERGEQLMQWIQDQVRKAPFQIKTTEAPSYRRIAHERMIAAGMTAEQMKQTSVHPGYGIRGGWLHAKLVLVVLLVSIQF